MCADYFAMVADAAQAPGVIFVCALCIFIAGLGCGAWAADIAEDDLSDAGDTHAHLPPSPPSPPPATRRVRAIGSELKPSYDGRQQRQSNANPPPTSERPAGPPMPRR